MHKKFYCSSCDAELAPWETVYSWQNGKHSEWLCEDCFQSYIDELTLAELAELIGSEVCEVEELTR